MHPRLTPRRPAAPPDPQAKRRAGQASRGLTLIELVIAIAVLSLGTLTAFAVLDQARLGIGGESPRLLARLVAENRIEALRLRALGGQPPDGLPEVVEMGGQRFRLEVERQRTAGGLVELRVRAVALEGTAGVWLLAYLPGGAT